MQGNDAGALKDSRRNSKWREKTEQISRIEVKNSIVVLHSYNFQQDKFQSKRKLRTESNDYSECNGTKQYKDNKAKGKYQKYIERFLSQKLIPA